MEAITDLINADAPTADDLEKANEALDTLRRVEPVAPEPLKAQLIAHDEIVKGYLDDLNEDGTADLETTGYKAAGLEISQICLDAFGG